MLHDIFIFRKIKEGDIGAFERLFRNYYTPLCFYATGITGRMDVSEEIVQELFYVLWRDRDKLQVLQSLKSYLYGAVKNRSLQYLEHRRVREKYREDALEGGSAGENLSPEDELEYIELEQLVKDTLKKMPERRRRIFSMHRFEKKKYIEIADSLSISVKTVEAEMTKALRALRISIGRYSN